MLRALVLLLILANGLYFAWSQEKLRAWGYGPSVQREPERLQQQIRPEAIRVLTADEARASEAAVAPAVSPDASGCLQAGPLDAARAESLRAVLLQALPLQAWTFEPLPSPARWLVYLGRYTDPQALARKRAELVALNLRPDTLSEGPLAPGLSLGSFESEARARAELAAFGRRGVRSASVVSYTPPSRGSLLKLQLDDETARQALESIRPRLGDLALRACG